MATITWQKQVARWTNGSEAGRIIACLDRELQLTIRRYASFQETPSLHAKGSLGYLNSMYFSISYKMHMGRKQIRRGFSVFSRPIFLICVCVGNVMKRQKVCVICWACCVIGCGEELVWIVYVLESEGGLLVRWACIRLYPVKLASLPFLFCTTWVSHAACRIGWTDR